MINNDNLPDDIFDEDWDKTDSFGDLEEVTDFSDVDCDTISSIKIGKRTTVPWRIVAGRILKRIRGEAGKPWLTFTIEELNELSQLLYELEDDYVKDCVRCRPRTGGWDS